MLIIFGGLPGTGKTTLSQLLVREIHATYVRIDALEQAILDSHTVTDVGTAGYFAGYAIAAENLRLGSTVVADSVNALAIVRDSWVEVARTASVSFVEIEVICSDTTEHRRRVESRTADILGHQLPSWREVLDREYEPWKRERVVIDTAILSASVAVERIIKELAIVR